MCGVPGGTWKLAADIIWCLPREADYGGIFWMISFELSGSTLAMAYPCSSMSAGNRASRLPLLNHPSGQCSNFPYVSSVIRLLHLIISDTELVAAIQAVSSKDLIQVVDFTTVLDERETPQAVGFIVELSEPLGTF